MFARLPLNASLTLATVMAAAALVPSEALALTAQEHAVSPAGVCQPTSPLNLGGLRFRPLGIYNASANSIYLSCSIAIDYRTDEALDTATGFYSLFLYVDAKNDNSVARTIDCTVVPGNRYYGTTTYTWPITVAANSLQEFGAPEYYQRGSYGSLNINCLLPPNMELSEFYIYEYDKDDQF